MYNIAFICVADDIYLKKYERCISSQKKYCEKNNYTYILKSDNKFISAKEDWYWKKIYELKDNLENYDFAVLIDSDCEITEKAEPIEKELDLNSIYYVLGVSKRPNTGFLIVKNNERGVEFLNDVFQKKGKKTPEQFLVYRFERFDCDNSCINWSIAENNSNTKILDLKWNCSQPDFKKDAYIIHYTNKMSQYYNTKLTLESLKTYLKKIFKRVFR